MIQLTLYITTLISGFIFIQMNHPLAMGLMLLVQTLLICLMTGLTTKTFWFSYILFLIFLGGMLVLFIYVTSLASNDMFSLSMKLIMTSIALLMILLTCSLLMDKTLINTMVNNEMHPINMQTSFINENILNLDKLYNYPTNMITILLINYLLITLIAIVKITNLFYGPLRLLN